MDKYHKFYWGIFTRNKLIFLKLIAVKVGLSFSKGLTLFSLIPLLTSQLEFNLFNKHQADFFTNSITKINDQYVFYVFLISGLFFIFLNYWLTKIETNFVEKEILDIKSSFITNIENTKWKFLKQRKNAKLLNSFYNEIEFIHYGIKSYLYLITVIFQLLVFLLLSFLISWKISLISVIFTLPLYFLYKFLRRKMHHNTTNELLAKENEIYFIQEKFSDLKKFKLFGFKQKDKLLENFQLQELIQNLNTKINADSTLINEIFAGFIFIGIYLFLKLVHIAIIPEVLIFLYILSRILPLINYILATLLELSKIGIYITNFKEKEEEFNQFKEEFSKVFTIDYLNADIQFNNVCFQYNHSKKILDNFSFEIKHTKMNALFGPSGQGKTTLIDILLSLLQADSGEIVINGKSIENTKIHFNSLSYIPQENPYLNESLRTYLNHDKNHSDEKIVDLIKHLKAFHFILDLDFGLESELGENGNLFSSGEKQRIAFLKMLLDKNDFVILDESTSYLDEDFEIELFEFLHKNKSENQTILFISHRKNLLLYAENVIYLS